MHIILEGLDKVGKTTLANFLSEQLKMPIKKFSAPKEGESPFVQYSEFLVNESRPYIIDRFYMSELAYGPVKRGFSEIDNVRKALLESMCKEINTFNVYCHAPVKDIEARFTTDKETFLTVDEIKPIAENFLKEIETSKLVWRSYQIGDSMQNISDFYITSRDEVR